MSTSDRALLEETQKELQIWKDRYSTIYQENERLKAAMDKYIGNDEPPTNGQRLEIPTDPLQLPEPCAMRILRFLPSIDLLKATEVSKQWKRYIESGSKLMKRAINGTVLNINFDQTKLEEVILSGLQREYKHMKISYWSKFLPSSVSSLALYPAIKQSSTLETLRVSSLYFDFYPNFFERKFSNLVKLELKCSEFPFTNIPKFPFLELTTLKIKRNDYRTVKLLSINQFEQFLCSFPKLQHLQINDLSGFHFLSADHERSTPEVIVKDRAQPKLQTIVLSTERYLPNFFRSHQNSLTKLMVAAMDTLDLSLCLRDLKQLQSLTVGLYYLNMPHRDFAYPQNDSIEIFTICQNFVQSYRFHQMLIAIPSLKELAVKYCTRKPSDDIRFLAANMRNLKWYKTKEFTDEDLEVYNEVKQNEDQYINTNFKLANDEDVDYESFEELQI